MRSAVLFCLLGALGCSQNREPGFVEGSVTWRGQGIAGALVEVYTRADRDPTVPPVAEATSGEDGSYRMELPPGLYWIWARATTASVGRQIRLVGQATRNPVRVAAGEGSRADVVLGDPSGFQAAAGPEGAGVRGRVEGAPPAEITVYVYPGKSERPTGPGFLAAVVPGQDGFFRVDLTPGEYTLAPRWRASGRNFGNLSPGDRVTTTQVRVAPTGYVDVGTLELRPVDPVVLRSLSTAVPETNTAIVGRVVDGRGVPAAGLRVLAFTDPRMAGKPLALSRPTEEDGGFRLDLPQGGRFFLGARSRLGGPAEPGEMAGSYPGEDGSGVHVEDGEVLENVTISVEEIW